MKDKTEEMSELVETLRAAAEKCVADGWWHSESAGLQDIREVAPEQARFIALCSPGSVLKLLSSLPPSPSMRIGNVEGAAISVIRAIHGAVSRGNMNIESDDPVTCALWIGATSLLKDFMESGSLPPSGAASEATVNQEMLAALKRAETLLVAVRAFIEVNELDEFLVHYDDADCDGGCLCNDCKASVTEIRDAISRAEALHEG